jgi:hypothetical protein
LPFFFFAENTKNIVFFKDFSKKDELIFADSESYIIFAREIKKRDINDLMKIYNGCYLDD